MDPSLNISTSSSSNLVDNVKPQSTAGLAAQPPSRPPQSSSSSSVALPAPPQGATPVSASGVAPGVVQPPQPSPPDGIRSTGQQPSTASPEVITGSNSSPLMPAVGQLAPRSTQSSSSSLDMLATNPQLFLVQQPVQPQPQPQQILQPQTQIPISGLAPYPQVQMQPPPPIAVQQFQPVPQSQAMVLLAPGQAPAPPSPPLQSPGLMAASPMQVPGPAVGVSTAAQLYPSSPGGVPTLQPVPQSLLTHTPPQEQLQPPYQVPPQVVTQPQLQPPQSGPQPLAAVQQPQTHPGGSVVTVGSITGIIIPASLFPSNGAQALGVPDRISQQVVAIKITGIGPDKICRNHCAGTCDTAKQSCSLYHAPKGWFPVPTQACYEFQQKRCRRRYCWYFHGTPQELSQLYQMDATLYRPERLPSALARRQPNNRVPFAGRSDEDGH